MKTPINIMCVENLINNYLNLFANFYKKIFIADDHSRIVLENQASDYINANAIDVSIRSFKKKKTYFEFSLFKFTRYFIGSSSEK